MCCFEVVDKTTDVGMTSGYTFEDGNFVSDLWGIRDSENGMRRSEEIGHTMCSRPAINFLLITLHAKYSPVCEEHG
jgi:hypothetical protein